MWSYIQPFSALYYRAMKAFLTNKPLRILLITNSMILIAGALLGPIYALFVTEVGGDLLDAGMTGAMFAFAAGVTVLFAGRRCDKAKYPAHIVAFGYAVMGIGYLLYLLVNSMMTLLMVQIVIGFGEAFYAPSFDALYSKHLDKNKEGGEWGSWEAMNYFSIALGAVIGGFIARQYGFSVLFIGMAILCFVSAAYMYTHSKGALSNKK